MIFESEKTGEIGNWWHVLRNLIETDYRGHLFLNLKWHRVYCA